MPLPFRFAVAAILCTTAVAHADGPKPAITKLAVHPAAVAMKGADDAPQLLVSGERPSAAPVDLTGDAAYTVSDPKVARVDVTGRVYPLANGSADEPDAFVVHA